MLQAQIQVPYLTHIFPVNPYGYSLILYGIMIDDLK
jgi:hypothetical protein